MSSWTPEARKAADFLAGLPSGSTTLRSTDTTSLLLESGGQILARGRLYNIVSKHLGAGVYRITLELANP